MATDMTVLSELEGTGEKFSLDALLDVRARTRKAVHLIAAQVKPGMAEEDAKEVARETLRGLGMRRGWHHIIVRCGPNTTKDFMARSEPGVVLGTDDIFFVDIGPIYGDTEGDAGDTFVLGSNPEHLRAKREVRMIWNQVRRPVVHRGHNRRAALPVRHRHRRALRLEAEPRSLGAPAERLPALGPLRRPPGRGGLPPQPQPVGARDRHRPPRRHLRRLLRGPAPRRPVVPGVTGPGGSSPTPHTH